MENKSFFTEVGSSLKQIMNIELEYIKLLFSKKLTILLSSMLLLFVIMIMILCALIFFAMAVANLLSFIMSECYVYMLIGAMFVLFMLVVYVFRRVIIVNPISRIVSRIVFDK